MTNNVSDSNDDGSIAGTSDSDVIFGGTTTLSPDGGTSVNDTIDGGQSDDTVYAGDGDDLIFGGDAGDAAGGGGDSKVVESFQFDLSKADPVVDGSQPGALGNSITYNDIATAEDGSAISVKISIVGMSNTNLPVSLGDSDSYPILLSGGYSGETVDIQVDFLDSDGNPVTIDSNFTFRDIDNAGSSGREGVTFDTTDITSYAVSSSPTTSVQADNRGDVIEFLTNSAGGTSDENLWTQVFFEGQSSLNFSIEARAGNAGYGFDTANFSNTPIISEVDASGSDLLYGGDGDDSALGGGGNDTIYGERGDDTLDGGKGDDTLFGGQDNDILFGGEGADSLDGGSGTDTADYSNATTAVSVDLDDGGQSGDAAGDTYTSIEHVLGSSLDDTLTGSNTANDTLEGDDGNDIIDGDGGNDSLIGGDGEDELSGGDGDDNMSGGNGADSFDGGAGSDTVDYSASAERVLIDLDAGTSSGGDAEGDSFKDIEAILGSGHNDVLTADEDGSTLLGGGGHDSLYGGKKEDSLDGGSGDDTLFGGDGQDNLAGGSGQDLLYGGKDKDTLDGGAGRDVLYGGDKDDSLDGGAADDTLFGGDGDDSLAGGEGDDTLFGGSGSNTLSGGDGADTIDIGLGDNVVIGGDGADVFVISSANYSDLGTDAQIEDAFFDLNLSGIDGWQATKGHDAGEGEDGAGDAGLIDVKDIGKEVDAALKPLVGKKSANEAEKMVEEAVEAFLANHDGSPISPKDISDLAYEVLEPEYGFSKAGLAGLKVYGEVKDQLGVVDSSEQTAESLRDDLLARATDTTIEDFEIGTDQLDLTGHDYLGGTGLSTNDVGISDTVGDGTGDAVLNLPNGSTITLKNISVYELDPEALESMGFQSSSDSTGVQNQYLLDAGMIGGGGGDDAITGSEQSETISGGTGADTIVLGGGADTVSGGDDQDLIVVGDGFDGSSIDAGSGGTDNDLLDFADVTAGITVTGSASGSGTLTNAGDGTGTFTNVENIKGSGNDDLIDFSGATDTGSTSIDSGEGHDSVAGGGGNDTLSGDLGDDTVAGGSGDDLIYGGEGNDNLRTGTGNDTLFGGEGDDVLANSSGDDVLYGGTGEDSVIASLGDDTLYGGTGSDSMTGGLDNDALYGGDGDDILYGGADPTDPSVADPKFSYEFYELDGNSLTDLASAGFDATGNTTLTPDGHGTTDIIDALGLDTAHGGDGDTFAIKLSTVLTVTTSGNYTFETRSDDGSKLFVNGVEIIDNDGVQAATTVSGAVALGPGEHTVEIVYFENTGNETLSATISGPDTGGSPIALESANVVPNDNDDLFGGIGNDTIYGGEGDDALSGEAGNDTLEGGAGDDLIYGGDGDDSLTTGTGNDTLFGGAGNDNLANSSGDDILYGGTGDDSILASLGNDTLYGGDGNDSLDGGVDNDALYGGAGNDTVAGGAGSDLIYSGAGDDTIVLSDGGGADAVSDFAVGNDILDSSSLDDTGNVLTNQDGAVTADEVTVTGGGGSDQVLTFPSGETLTVPDGTVDTSTQQTQFASLVSMGVPPCFAPCTRILTPKGERAVEDLWPGDLVMTADRGPQPIRWIGRREVDFRDPTNQRASKDKPILIKAGALGPGLPRRDLVVSPQHRMVIAVPQEALASAKHLTSQARVRVMRGCRQVTYFAILLDRHEILFAEGARTESYRPGPVSMSSLTPEQRAEIYAIYPGLAVDPEAALGPSARPILDRKATLAALEEQVAQPAIAV